jgi:hypothetical protein
MLVGLTSFTLIALMALIIGTDNKPLATKNFQNTQPAILSLVNPIGGQTAAVGQIQNVSWTSTDYSSDKVNVNLIRKVSDNPASYALVRTIVSNKKNTGQATWIPNIKDTGDLFIEVGCVTSDQACRTVTDTSRPLAVIQNKSFINTASAYEALEGLFNR